MSSIMPKLTAKSQAKQPLASKFRGRQMTGYVDPKDVWLSDPILQQHKLNNFRTHYNDERKHARDTGIFNTVNHLFDLTIF